MEAIGSRLGSDGPGHAVDILLLEQALEPAYLLVAPVGRIAVEEAADQQIGFLRSAVPGAVAQASQAGLVIHAAPMRNWPAGAGDARRNAITPPSHAARHSQSAVRRSGGAEGR